MSSTLRSRRHETLIAFLIDRREQLGLTQSDVAKRLGQWQSFVARVESGQRRIDVVELLDFAEALSFDPRQAIKRLTAVKRD